jgi:teichuronic acid biosynthesis glycosyltransferase TuaG
MNLVSIITPSYNSDKFISKTIESVLSQTYGNWEMLIVDDCSQDNSLNIISKYIIKDPRIKLIPLNKNVGPAEARNRALRIASGRFIAFLDSDDIWFPTKLEYQIQYMIKNRYAFSFTSYDIIKGNTTKKTKVIVAPFSINYSQYLRNTIIGCLTVVIDKEEIGYFEMPDIKSSHDMALWLLLLKRNVTAYGINKVLASYRLVTSSNTANKLKASTDVWHVYRQIEKINFIKSVFLFICYSINAVRKRL